MPRSWPSSSGARDEARGGHHRRLAASLGATRDRADALVGARRAAAAGEPRSPGEARRVRGGPPAGDRNPAGHLPEARPPDVIRRLLVSRWTLVAAGITVLSAG